VVVVGDQPAHDGLGLGEQAVEGAVAVVVGEERDLPDEAADLGDGDAANEALLRGWGNACRSASTRPP
jgi:hypothetical protein